MKQGTLIKFQKGAFLPKLPVQPVIVSYPYCSHDVSWTPDYNTLPLLFRTLCQVSCAINAESGGVVQPGTTVSMPVLTSYCSFCSGVGGGGGGGHAPL